MHVTLFAGLSLITVGVLTEAVSRKPPLSLLPPRPNPNATIVQVNHLRGKSSAFLTALPSSKLSNVLMSHWRANAFAFPTLRPNSNATKTWGSILRANRSTVKPQSNVSKKCKAKETTTNMNNLYGDRDANAHDCKWLCGNQGRQAWCVHYEFSSASFGTCELYECVSKGQADSDGYLLESEGVIMGVTLGSLGIRSTIADLAVSLLNGIKRLSHPTYNVTSSILVADDEQPGWVQDLILVGHLAVLILLLAVILSLNGHSTSNGARAEDHSIEHQYVAYGLH